MASSKAGFQQKDDGTLVVFDQWASGDELELGAAEDDLGGLDLDATTIDDPTISNSIQDFRITGSSSDPVPSGFLASTVYLIPYIGNRIALYTGSEWVIRTASSASLSTSGFTASRPHDIFAYDNGGTVTLEATAWTSDLSRATALVRQDGVLVRSGATTRRYLGTVYVDGSKFTRLTLTQSWIWNFYNKITRHLVIRETTANWTYNSSTWRPLNNNSANHVDIVVGIQYYRTLAVSSNVVAFLHKNEGVMAGIGLNSTTSDTATLRTTSSGGGDGDGWYNTTSYGVFTTVGRNIFYALERSDGTNITLYSGDSTNVGAKSGIQCQVEW